MSATATKEKRRYKRLTPTEWAEAEALWKTGGPTLEELAARFAVTVRALQAHFAKHGIRKGAAAAALASAVEERVLAAALPAEDELSRRIRATKESAYRNAVKIEQLVLGQVEAAQNPGTAMGAVAALRALDLAATALDRTRRSRWAALGLDKGVPASGELPELPIRDLTEGEVEAIRAQQLAEDAATLGAEGGHADADDVVIEGENEDPSPGPVRAGGPETATSESARDAAAAPDAVVERVGGDESQPRVIGRG